MERSSMSSRCAWCGFVKISNQWLHERRQGFVNYTHGICPKCWEELALDGIESQDQPSGQ